MTHASRIAQQLREIEEDEELPEERRESARERRKEVEREEDEPDVGQKADLVVRDLDGVPTVAITVTAIAGGKFHVADVVETLQTEYVGEVRP